MNKNDNIITANNIDSYYRYLGLNGFGAITKKQSKLFTLTHILCSIVSVVIPVSLGLLISNYSLFILTFIISLLVSETIGTKIINKKKYKDFIRDFPNFDMTLSRDYVKLLIDNYHLNTVKQEAKLVENSSSVSMNYHDEDRVDLFNKMASSDKIAFLEKEKEFYMNKQEIKVVKEKKIGTIK